MDLNKYTLKNKKPVICGDLMEWGLWLGTVENRTVAQTEKGGVQIRLVRVNDDIKIPEGNYADMLTGPIKFEDKDEKS